MNGDTLNHWAYILGCKVGVAPFSYLGATIGTPANRIQFWNPLKSKVQRKLDTWDASKLSMAGRLILLKAAIDSIPSYWVSLYRVPEQILKELEQLQRNFLWGTSSTFGRKIHLVRWEEICKPKLEGGLGLTSLKIRNLGMLAKWWWRLYSERNKTWNSLLIQCYGHNLHYDVGVCKLHSGVSSTIRSVVNLGSSIPQVLNRNCFRWKLLNGNKIYFWEDWWSKEGPLKDRFQNLYARTKWKHITVNSFMQKW